MQQCIQPTGTNRPRAWRSTRSCSLWNAQWLLCSQAWRRSCEDRLPAERTVSGGHGGGETPVPIPNTAVKPARADGTWGETPWESRSSPEFISDAPICECRWALSRIGIDHIETSSATVLEPSYRGPSPGEDNSR